MSFSRYEESTNLGHLRLDVAAVELFDGASSSFAILEIHKAVPLALIRLLVHDRL